MRTAVKITPQSTKGNLNMTIEISRNGHSEIDATHLSSLFSVYLADCARSGVTARTLEGYDQQIKPFQQWWQDNAPKHNHRLTREVIMDFFNWLRYDYRTRFDRPAAQNTLRSTCRRVRQMCHWLYNTNRLPINIASWMPLPPAPRAKGKFLSTEEIQRLVDSASGMNRLRNIALISYLLDTGVRKSEAANVTYDETIINPDRSGHTLLSFTKRYQGFHDPRTVVFSALTGSLLQMLAFMTGRSTGKIFDLTDKGIQLMLTRLSQVAEVELVTHDTRHTFSNYWLRHCEAPNKYMVEMLMRHQLGHKPRTVTEGHYIHIDYREVKAHYVSPMREILIPGLQQYYQPPKRRDRGSVSPAT